MAEKTKIEWTDHTFNPWIGCQKVSTGCDLCYAEASMDHRFGRVLWGAHGQRVRTSERNWKTPLRWAKAAKLNATRPKVFCASLADIWDNKAPDEWRADLFRLIDLTPQLDWLLLTKRPENVEKMLPTAIAGLKAWPWSNVWLGVTCENQEQYTRRWPILRKVPAVLHFVSYEPALGPLALPLGRLPDWIICGGESGSGARFMNPEWAQNLLKQCRRREIAFFMKQMTRKRPIPPELLVRQFPTPQLETENV